MNDFILIGPRQVGKTTLARQITRQNKKKNIHFFDLEDPTDFVLLENPNRHMKCDFNSAPMCDYLEQ